MHVVYSIRTSEKLSLLYRQPFESSNGTRKIYRSGCYVFGDDAASNEQSKLLLLPTLNIRAIIRRGAETLVALLAESHSFELNTIGTITITRQEDKGWLAIVRECVN